jgi:hypothetical protein
MVIVAACLQGAAIKGAKPCPKQKEDDMSSTPAASHFDKAGFKLVREALRTAGLRGVDSDASSDMKRDASIFLTAQFRGGARTKTALLEALDRRSRLATAGAPFDHISKEGAIERWKDVGRR